MRFSLKQAGSGSERIGSLTDFVRSPSTVIETPTSALFTQGGSVVHITADVLSKVFTTPQLLWMSVSNTMRLEPGVKVQGEGITKFSGLQEHIACITYQNMSDNTPLGHFETDKVPLWTKHGKKMIDADRYMDIMEVFKPDMILAIADGRTSFNEGTKRLSKSVSRTSNMMDECAKRYKAQPLLRDSSFIGVVVGAPNKMKLEESVRNILKYKDILGGIALQGLTDGTEDAFNVPEDKLEEIFVIVQKDIPKDIVRVIEGCWNPAVVVAAIGHGWDVFDGSYPLKLTNSGQALALNFDTNRNSTEMCILNLSDTGYKEDFRPILEGCECLACREHTRAYIQHLLNTREMLSSVLLNIHNLHHFDQMFVHARRHIASNTYQTYKEHITAQYQKYKQSVPETKKEEIKEVQAKKKICVSAHVNGSVTNSCQ